ncbi:hypothetical protein IQ251_02605 [Saccharopolyspora sp. HNM0983]|uniref:Methyltransferase n=1 Tax=Saccharopolyspora montiporae TaxID=2781240 RepID=A0A929FYF3_9PSEU|nr:methyltransferase [Saccharopolyspora sp. HNM0983]MBE9373329.1 hypothetical protein [Saccharopolyspora sp. HNM0983]
MTDTAGATSEADGILGPEAASALIHLNSQYFVHAAVELGLPDQVAESGSTVAEIAERAGADPAAVRRLLRMLSAIGIFQAGASDTFAHTPGSAALRSTSATDSMMNAFVRNEQVARMWEQLPAALRSGESAFGKAAGKPFYDYINQDDPALAESFNAAMTNNIGSTNGAVVEALDLSSSTDLVDVGGGQGTLLRDLLQANPHLHGRLFDIEHALSDVDLELRSGALADRCEIVEGDARMAVPTGADVYVLRTILHNWDDESCAQMLRAIARDAKPGARVLVVELVLPENGQVSVLEAMFDMMMFATFGAAERTEAEYAALFERAGLEHVGVFPTSSQFSIVEAAVR